MASSSSSLNWLYDVFVSFRGEDVRVTFLSHFLKELHRKLINAFKDYEIIKSRSLWPELVQAIRSSRIAVVVFSKNYASSSWCLDELLEIVNCNIKIIIPIFYDVDPSDVRKQTGEFGKIFEKTCKNKTEQVKNQLKKALTNVANMVFGKIFEETCKNNPEQVKNQWKKALTDVADMAGFDFANCENEAKMIEEIANDVLRKLLSTSSEDFENSVGIEDHMAKMSELLQLESKEVRMVGIWGSSGIGKTTIARALFNQLPQHFQVSKFVDRAFVSKSKENYTGANPDDHNMKLHLLENFLSEILGIKDIKIGHLGALRERLQHQKVLIIIDDLDDLVVLEVLAGKTQWFGSGSRIIVVTNNKHFLRAHDIHHIYEVSFPTEVQAFQMLCQSAFRKNYAPEGFQELVVEVARQAGSLPLALNILGKYLKGRDKEYWVDMLPRLQNGLDDKIEKIIRISYDGLCSEEKAIFRHIACQFNHMEETTIKSLLADSNWGVNIALPNLADKSLIHVKQGYVVMHSLLEEMGRKIVRTKSIDKPGEREFLVDSKDICYVLGEGNGTSKVLGISLDTREIDELHIPENAFNGMYNLRYLEIDSNNYRKEGTLDLPESFDYSFLIEMHNLRYLKIVSKKYGNEGPLHLPKSFDYVPLELKILCWPKYPMNRIPSNFFSRYLVKLNLRNSKLEKLWEGAAPLTCLKEMDMLGSVNLKEIPDLSKATNLETLCLGYCSSLVELPSSIGNLNKLLKLDMADCYRLKTLPTGFNLKSLNDLSFSKCQELRTFPEFSTNISILKLSETNIEEFPSNLHLENLVELVISKVESDGKQWDGVKPLTPFLAMLSPTVTTLSLWSISSLVELPSSIQNLNQLRNVWIWYCKNLETLPTGINLKSLDYLSLHGCSRLRSFPEISTNISTLDLDRTGIEEVPWWIEKFSKLVDLNMERCRKLKRVSLNISKLKHLESVNFSYCGKLPRVNLSGNSSEVAMEADNIDTVHEEASSSLSDDYVPIAKLDFSDCFKLDQDALLQQQSISFNYMVFPGEEVPPYFTYRTTVSCLRYSSKSRTCSSLRIPLLHVPLSQPFFRFRACALLVDCPNEEDAIDVHVICEFKGRFGNNFDAGIHFEVSRQSFKNIRRGSRRVIILDCRIPINEDNAPLAQRNYDHVKLQIDVHNVLNSRSILKGWGIRLLEDSSSSENRLGYPNTLQHVCEVDKDNTVSDGCHKTEYSEESEDSDDYDICSETDQSEVSGDSDIGNETDQLPHVSEDNMPLQGFVKDNMNTVDSGDSNVETEKSRKRKRL